MCGIAGLVRIDGGSSVPSATVYAMTNAIRHRGPDDDGHWFAPGVALGARRLSIVGVSDGHQPVGNEDDTVHAVFNGEIYDFMHRRRELQDRGHRLKTLCDTELLPHLWEEQREAMFEAMRGQFACAIYDTRHRRLVLARDRYGICPLYWTIQCTAQGAFLIFASEIKALLASGMVEAKPDPQGIDQTFTFFALPGPRTCFEGVNALPPGRLLSISFARDGEKAGIDERAYWQIDFPDRGGERPGNDAAVDRYETLLRQAVARRLQADVPVVCYLSGGIDSSIILALASELRGAPPPSFTLQIRAKGLDETSKALDVANVLNSRPTIVPAGMEDILAAYPRLIEAAECPVSDTCCSALLLLAQEVHGQGYKVALTGEGSDEMLAGYPWFKMNRLFAPVDALGFDAGNAVRRGVMNFLGLVRNSKAFDRRVLESIGGSNAWLGLYGLISAGKARVYGPRLKPLLGEYNAFEDLGLNIARARKWHPLNRSLYLGQRIHLPGLLLSIAGDRVAIHSSVETRYPFLDEDLTEFTQTLNPGWKLRLLQDKYILRRAAERHLPRRIAWRPKAMFRAPWDIAGSSGSHPDVLLGQEALQQSGYFDAPSVHNLLALVPTLRPGGPRRTLVDQLLAGVVMTQLWHHMFIEDLGIPIARINTASPAKPAHGYPASAGAPPG